MPFLVDSEQVDVDLSVVEEYCKLHHIMFKKVSALKKPNELKDYFEDVIHGKLRPSLYFSKIFFDLEICNSNYRTMLLEREEVVTDVKSSICSLI